MDSFEASIRPRIAPNPCGSGISVRRLPEPTFASIVEACHHYEEKTAGHYDAKSLAVRNLYALSREVQDMVRCLRSNEDVLSARVRELETVVREWNEVFASPSRALQAAGVTRASNTPSALAHTLVTLATTLQANDTQALATRSALEREVLDLRVALRDSGRVVREQCAREMGELRASGDSVVAFERAARAAAERALQQCRDTLGEEVAKGVAAATVALREEAGRAGREAAAAGEAARLARAQVEATAAASQASGRRERMEAELVKEDAEGRAERCRREAEEARGALEEAREGYRRAEEALEGRWRKKWEDTNAAWERSTGVVRTSALEAQIAFLTTRVRELQELCQAMQVALGNNNSSSGAGSGGGWAAGGATPATNPTLNSPAIAPASASASASASTLPRRPATAAPPTSKSPPWRGSTFGSAPVIVRHGALAVSGQAWQNSSAPAVTMYSQVR